MPTWITVQTDGDAVLFQVGHLLFQFLLDICGNLSFRQFLLPCFHSFLFWIFATPKQAEANLPSACGRAYLFLPRQPVRAGDLCAGYFMIQHFFPFVKNIPKSVRIMASLFLFSPRAAHWLRSPGQHDPVTYKLSSKKASSCSGDMRIFRGFVPSSGPTMPASAS